MASSGWAVLELAFDSQYIESKILFRNIAYQLAYLTAASGSASCKHLKRTEQLERFIVEPVNAFSFVGRSSLLLMLWMKVALPMSTGRVGGHRDGCSRLDLGDENPL